MEQNSSTILYGNQGKVDPLHVKQLRFKEGVMKMPSLKKASITALRADMTA